MSATFRAELYLNFNRILPKLEQTSGKSKFLLISSYFWCWWFIRYGSFTFCSDLYIAVITETFCFCFCIFHVFSAIEFRFLYRFVFVVDDVLFAADYIVPLAADSIGMNLVFEYCYYILAIDVIVNFDG